MLTIHWCFQLLLWNQGLFQLLSRCAGAGREHRQTASPSWSVEIFHTLDIMLCLWTGDGRGQEAIGSSLFCEFESSPVWEFKRFWEILKNSQIWHSATTAQGLAADQSLGGEKRRIAYSLFCIFVIIIVTIIISIISSVSISFVAFLNCLYLNPRVPPFCPLLLPIPLWGGRGGVSERLSSA